MKVFMTQFGGISKNVRVKLSTFWDPTSGALSKKCELCRIHSIFLARIGKYLFYRDSCKYECIKIFQETF